MKVGVVTDSPSLAIPGGYLHRLKEAWRDQGIDSEIVSMEGLRSLEIGSRVPWTRVMQCICSRGRLGRYDSVLVEYSLPLGACLARAKAKGLIRGRVLVHTHGFDVFRVESLGYGVRRFRFFDKVVCDCWNHADTVIAVCEAAKREICRSADGAKVSVVPNGVDSDMFTPSGNVDPRIEYLRRDGYLVVLNVAGLFPVKNHLGLLQAVSFLKMQGEVPPFKVVIVGDGPARSRIQQFIDMNRLRGDVVLLGSVRYETMPSVYRGADLFVLTSLSEGHPWSLLEAMSCSVAATGPAIGGIPETVARPAAIFDSRDAKQIAASMSKFLVDSGLRRAAGSGNRSSVLKRFTMKQHAHLMAELVCAGSSANQSLGGT